MAQKVSIELVDDLDGSTASETVTFGLDGTHYEIDLNKKNATKLRATLKTYVSSARTTGRGKVKPQAKRTTGPDPKLVRQWATENGIEVPKQGRVPKAVVDQYVAAN